MGARVSQFNQRNQLEQRWTPAEAELEKAFVQTLDEWDQRERAARAKGKLQQKGAFLLLPAVRDACRAASLLPCFIRLFRSLLTVPPVCVC